MRPLHGITFALCCFAASGCSNGEILGINSHPSAAPTTKPTPIASSSPALPSPTPSGSVTTANVTGKVVDFDSDSALSGIAIFVTPMSGTAYMQVATSDSSGNFSFSVAPGSYVIAVGSNSTSDETRATEHDVINVSAGANVIKPIMPSSVANYEVKPSESSGSFRLALLSSAEQSCFTGMNTGRASISIPLVVEDEEQLEFERAEVAEEIAQNTTEPSPMYDNGAAFDTPTGNIAAATDSGFNPCSAYTDGYSFGSGAEMNGNSLNSSVTWYAASYASGSSGPYEAQGWQIDPSQGGNVSTQSRIRQFHVREHTSI